jgi:hypothetical protein
MGSIGGCTAIRAAREGARVVCVDHHRRRVCHRWLVDGLLTGIGRHGPCFVGREAQEGHPSGEQRAYTQTAAEAHCSDYRVAASARTSRGSGASPRRIASDGP